MHCTYFSQEPEICINSNELTSLILYYPCIWLQMQHNSPSFPCAFSLIFTSRLTLIRVGFIIYRDYSWRRTYIDLQYYFIDLVPLTIMLWCSFSHFFFSLTGIRFIYHCLIFNFHCKTNMGSRFIGFCLFVCLFGCFLFVYLFCFFGWLVG